MRAAIVAAFVVVVLVECVLCNAPFFRSLAASGDSAAAYNTLGPGLERRDDGLLEVIDPTQAYLQVAADGSSDYVRVVPVSDEVLQGAEQQGERVLRTVRVRPDADRRACELTSVSLDSSRSLYVRAAAGRTVRMQVVEPKGSLIPFEAVRANVRVPFSVSPLRVALLALVMVLVALWRPGSRLWKVPLDTSSVRQRVALGVLLAIPGVATAAVVVWQLVSAVPLSFHTDGMYTYDYDQYDHVARALLDGHAWLDLDVPQGLRDADNPYDVATRQQLLADGVNPVYWDYAFFNGRWYSYFGVVPALLLFVPYRAVTSLWVDGGLMMPSGAAVPLLMFGFLVFVCLLTIRVIKRVHPHVSVAAVSMLCVFVLLASNASYLWYRTNFYSVPIAASLLLSTLGLWLWLGAERPSAANAGEDGKVNAVGSLSLPRLAAGSVCIAANMGCRPSFVVVAFAAFPLFWPQICAIAKQLRDGVFASGAHGRACAMLHTLRAPLAVLVPALVVVVPLFAYNMVRFSSPFDFGSSYQITVTDMTSYHQSWSNFIWTVAYYLFLPLRWTNMFPFLAVDPTPLKDWGFTEAMPGGLFVMVPLALASLACPFLRRHMRARGHAGMWRTLTTFLLLSLLIVALDARLGGLGWRYIADFGWLFALASLPLLLIALDCDRPRLCWLLRVLVLALLLFMLAVTVLSLFLYGRDDELIRNNSGLFHDVQSWFTLI
ncbi:hypothetical protein [Bifidobacterium catenulatum]|uniref:hypothetical protein n=1 Tax=Bifidobacterium catenulatum TaxID=1686 RepID=UPI0023EBC009|nr:hypothetical protein [Bifidobacterium catenulatum]MDF4086581.1 hypothetical protein [Bifidobacterium catenulatum]MDF4093022.1 hypothetical protein [Bifidobacterium catenulatum]